MPSVQDIANQVNNKLDQVVSNTAATVAVGNSIRGDIAQTNTRLDNLNANLQSGVSELSNGLFAIFEVLKVTNSILDHQTRQNDTIICELKNTNDLLCDITRKFTHQLRLSEEIVKSLKRVEGIAERTQPGAAADYDRQLELNKKIEECCPPEPPKPEPCPEPCRVPEKRPYTPQGQNWRPSRQTNPIG